MKQTPSGREDSKMQNIKHTHCVLFVCVLAFAAACNRQPTAGQQLDKIQSETKAAANDMKDYSFAQKNEFVSKMQGQLDALNQELDQLSARIEKSSEPVKAEAKPKLQAMRAEVAQLGKQLDELRNSTESTWDSVKAASQKTFASVKGGFQQSRQWLSDKIAP
jgi:chromosome segregation ATPase